MKKINIRFKTKHFLVLTLTFVLAITVVACDQSKQEDKAQDSTFLSDELTQNNSAEDAELKDSQPEQGASGPEPNPESQFGQLSLAEQEEMLSWLDVVQTAYSEMASSIEDFASQVGQLRSQVEGDTLLSDLPAFQDFKAKIETELARIDTATSADLSSAWSQVRKPFESTNQLYRSYLEKLSQMKVQSDDLVSQIQASFDALTSSMQEALDSLADFKS